MNLLKLKRKSKRKQKPRNAKPKKKLREKKTLDKWIYLQTLEMMNNEITEKSS